MQNFRHRSGAHPDALCFGPQFREHAQIRHVDQRKQRTFERHEPRRRDGVSHGLRKGVAARKLASAFHGDGSSGVTRDRTDHVFTDTRERRRCDAAFNRIDPAHSGRQRANGGRREHRKSRGAREHENARRARGLVERADAGNEIRAVREIEIVNPLRDAGFNDSVAPLAIGLKRSARIDEDIGPQIRQLLFDIALAIECRRHETRFHRATNRRECSRFIQGPPANDDGQARLVLDKLDQPAAERAVTADDQDCDHLIHLRNRSASSGVDTRHVSRTPNHLRRLRAMTS